MFSEPPTGAPPCVLIADDDPSMRDYIGKLLQAQGMRPEMADDGQKAVAAVRDLNVDLVLLDIVMPGMDGLDACRLIKGISQDTFLPVMLLTAKSDTDSRVTGLRIGADDYVCKPFDERELLARANNLIRIKRMHDQISAAKEKLATLAVQDELSGLYNYRYLHTRMSEEFKRAERYREPLATIMVDVDLFKRINDRYGHEAGDAVLRDISARLSRAVREVDVVTRYGGDEFLLVMPSTNFSGALAVADRVWRALAEAPFQVGRARESVTASLGVAVFPSRDIKTKDGLIKAADRALYQAKEEGRNRICVFQHQGYIYEPQAV
ncbi:MAG: diguanylate cyclase [Myxococcales bacterium]|nr:diguanylate cyclase [Myxococcales bacterium]MDD9972239.1 diguanylate cyclase [Myxococcales bacterium]